MDTDKIGIASNGMIRYKAYLYALAFFVVVAFAGLYFYERPIDITKFSFAAPCSQPIPYSVGTIDPRFNLTKEQIVARLADAADLWNSAAGKPVLAYEPDNLHAMPVNFVYDTRQQTVSLGSKIDSTEASQNAERSQLQTLQQQFVRAQQAYADAITSFNTASENYAQEVKRVNASGGADAATYTRLNAEQARLKDQQAQLKAQGDTLDAQAATLKSRIEAFNSSVHAINSVVDTFNANVAGDFEEGQYTREASGAQHIDIYAYKDQNELLHSLAHEFGHSLGLPHNSSTASIMFPYNKESVNLSSDDIATLKAACKLK